MNSKVDDEAVPVNSGIVVPSPGEKRLHELKDLVTGRLPLIRVCIRLKRLKQKARYYEVDL